MKPRIIQPFMESGDPIKYIVIKRPGCDMCVADGRGSATQTDLCRRLPECGMNAGGVQFLEYNEKNLALIAAQILEGNK